jgi:hypothetical protein
MKRSLTAVKLKKQMALDMNELRKSFAKRSAESLANSTEQGAGSARGIVIMYFRCSCRYRYRFKYRGGGCRYRYRYHTFILGLLIKPM